MNQENLKVIQMKKRMKDKLIDISSVKIVDIDKSVINLLLKTGYFLIKNNALPLKLFNYNKIFN